MSASRIDRLKSVLIESRSEARDDVAVARLRELSGARERRADVSEATGQQTRPTLRVTGVVGFVEVTLFR